MVERGTSFEYEGWNGNGDSLASARFTYLVGVWLLNDEALYQQTQHIATSAVDVNEAGQALNTWVKDVVLSDLRNDTPLASELLASALNDEVNWHEIVEAFRA
jgi:hypothetical protein